MELVPKAASEGKRGVISKVLGRSRTSAPMAQPGPAGTAGPMSKVLADRGHVAQGILGPPISTLLPSVKPATLAKVIVVAPAVAATAKVVVGSGDVAQQIFPAVDQDPIAIDEASTLATSIVNR